MKRFIVVIALAFSLFNAHAAKAPVLLVLEHSQADKIIQTKLEIKPGLVPSPYPGQVQTKWIIRAGEAVKSAVEPPSHNVNFFKKISNTQYMPLFIVNVRYFLDAAGAWWPRFQLNQEPLVMRQGNRWIPLTTTQGVASLIVQTGTALPNAQGYSASLELGFTNGATPIDAWLVQ
ncbi:MAG: hypothetical protein HY081_09910 [Gammaproteobacteria bacterium]|nr:hypothetical protein [Gammaproteobacteria bacterium]